ncbi:MAG TPA: hypothetical protein VEV65_13850 [Kineosporiaceae bacterium]|jgi:hypothetical protein|nr:hypothetical protein [Kineosporiaceae bacterium]
MGAVRGLVKSAVVLKLIDVARREAAKPENQAKARELAMRVAREVDKRRAARSASSSSRRG